VEKIRRDVVPPGTLAAGTKARRGAGLLRGIGVAAVLDGLVPGVRAAAPGVPGVAGVPVGRVRVRVAGGTGMVRPAGKGVGRPVGGRIRPGAVRVAAPLESGRIGHGKARVAG
jgi:hypothetical protein